MGYQSQNPSSPPSGDSESHHPLHLQRPQDGLNQAAGQMDKLDAKVGVRPEASRRPGQKPRGSPGTNGHMHGHAAGNMVPTCEAPGEHAPWSRSRASPGRVAALCPGNAGCPPRTPRSTAWAWAWAGGQELCLLQSHQLLGGRRGGWSAGTGSWGCSGGSVPADKGPPLPTRHTCSATGLTGPGRRPGGAVGPAAAPCPGPGRPAAR